MHQALNKHKELPIEVLNQNESDQEHPLFIGEKLRVRIEKCIKDWSTSLDDTPVRMLKILKTELNSILEKLE